MMRSTILLLIFLLSTGILTSQDQKLKRENVLKGKKDGDLMEGEYVQYKVLNKDFDYLYICNINNKDTINRNGDETFKYKSVIDTIYEIVYNNLTMEELSRIIETKLSGLIIRCIPNKEFRVQEVIFNIRKDEYDDDNDYWVDALSRNPTNDSLKMLVEKLRKDVREKKFSPDIDDFWLCFTADRFYEIEKNIIKKVEIDEKERRWINNEDIENKYLDISIKYEELAKMRENGGKVIRSPMENRGLSNTVRGIESGQIVNGEKAVYYVILYNNFYEVKNINYQENIVRINSEKGKYISQGFQKKIEECFYKHINPKELYKPYKDSWDDLYINFNMNEDLTIEKIIFIMSANDNFWINLPIDMFHEIEKEIIENVKVTEEHEIEWFNSVDYNNGEFCVAKILYTQLFYMNNNK